MIRVKFFNREGVYPSSSSFLKVGWKLLPRIAGGVLSCKSKSPSIKELQEKYFETDERISRVTHVAFKHQMHQATLKAILDMNPVSYVLAQNYREFKSVLPKSSHSKVTELEKFVERFEKDYPDLKPLHEYLKEICCNQKTANHFGTPDLSENLRCLETHITYWEQLFSLQKKNSEKFWTPEISKEFENKLKEGSITVEEIEQDYNLAKKSAPIFLGLLGLCHLDKKAFFNSTDPHIRKVLEREDALLPLETEFE